MWAAQNMSEDEILGDNDGKHTKETLELCLKYFLTTKTVAIFLILGPNHSCTTKALVNCKDVEQRNINCLTISVNEHASEHCNTMRNNIMVSDPDTPGNLNLPTEPQLSLHLAVSIYGRKI